MTTPRIEEKVSLATHALKKVVAGNMTQEQFINAFKQTLESLHHSHKEEGIKQGTLYGYDLMLMAPKDVIGDVINEKTLETYHKEELEQARRKIIKDVEDTIAEFGDQGIELVASILEEEFHGKREVEY